MSSSLELKRLSADDFKAGTQPLIAQIDARIAGLDPKEKTDKRTITALGKDKDALNARLARTDAVLKAIGGQISEADARRLILKKIYDIVRTELDRYLNAEKRVLVRAVENLWEKYAIAAGRTGGTASYNTHHDGRFTGGIGVPVMTILDGWKQGRLGRALFH